MKQLLISGGALIIGLFLGYLVFTDSNHAHHPLNTTTEYTCTMHPQIRQNEPGKCPICGMDLVPLETESNSAKGLRLTTSELSANGIEMMTVTRQIAHPQIHVNGRFRSDIRREYHQRATTVGRIEAVRVSGDGVRVRRGDILFEIYAPAWENTQRELQTAIRNGQTALIRALKDRLRNAQVADADIERIATSKTLFRSFPIRAQRNGIILEMPRRAGDSFSVDQALVTIIDISALWIEVDVPQEFAHSIEIGDSVSIERTGASTIRARVDQLRPVIDLNNRQRQLRVYYKNPRQTVIPGHDFNGILKHLKQDSIIVIPRSAVLWTGPRSIVYRRVNGEFRAQWIEIGPLTDVGYPVLNGLQVGDEIVQNGVFQVDAAAQLTAFPSMMNPPAPPMRWTDANKQLWTSLLTDYFRLSQALASDQFDYAQRAFQSAQTRFAKYADKHRSDPLLAAIDQLRKSAVPVDLKSLRNRFLGLSRQFKPLIEQFNPQNKSVYIQHCPMADDNRGADWLSLVKAIQNPYFGEQMLTCGETSNEIPAN